MKSQKKTEEERESKYAHDGNKFGNSRQSFLQPTGGMVVS